MIETGSISAAAETPNARPSFFPACIKSIAYALTLALFATATARAQSTNPIPLKDGWAIQSSAKVPADGATVSRPGYAANDWYPATVPTTVLAALVADKVYSDPYFGMNLRSIPGTKYKIGANFSNEDMPHDSPFRVPWWYRTEFEIPADAAGKALWLNFKGINYRADIWVNGQKLAGTGDVAGPFRRYEFDATKFLLPGKKNAIAIAVFAPKADELGITWVDWNPAPPDKDMGVWGDVSLAISGPVAVRNLQVDSKLDQPDLATAHLTVSAELRNATDRPVAGMLHGTIGDEITFEQSVSLAAHESKVITFAPAQYPALNIANPKLWWPYRMGAQNMNMLSIEFSAADGVASDAAHLDFGIDEITSELTSPTTRLFKINGKKILIRGGGYSQDMLLRDSPAEWNTHFSYAKAMNLNTIRLEGKLPGDDFFALADRYGLLIMPGWCCCDHWEKWKDWKSDERSVATKSERDQALRLRTHPSVLMWLYGSDGPPPPDVEKAYLDVLADVKWNKPVVSSASQHDTSVSGASGVKMTGPYDYVPPDYWLQDTASGGAFGFNTETSPGPAVLPIESLKQMLPPEHLWPIDDFWNFHAGGGRYHDTHIFDHALEMRYGKAVSLGDYERKSQAMAYEGERAMFEAYGANKYKATGVIQWMLNNAWPSTIWHLYDYYWRAAGGFYGTQRACEPLHAQYSYADRSIQVANDQPKAYQGLTLDAAVYDLKLAERFSRSAAVEVAANGVTTAFAIPPIADLSETYFLKLTLRDASGAIASNNFYWLSTHPDTLDWKHGTWWYTPEKDYADLTALQSLPPVKLQVESSFESVGQNGASNVTLENRTSDLAFQVRVKLTQGKGGADVLPIIWDDDYISLLPGEKRELHSTYRLSDLNGTTPAIEVTGWNVQTSTE
jgi:exo-1,4-beta-D-glucosaminidase